MASILIIEHDPGIYEFIELNLEKEGYKVVVANDAPKAQKILQEQEFELVLISINAELIKSIYYLYPATLIIALVSHIPTNPAASPGEVFDYIQYPIDRDKLCLAVSRALQMRALKDENSKFQLLVENAVDGIFISLENEGKTVYANSQAVKITGYTPDELLHIPIERLLVPEEYVKLMHSYKSQFYSKNTTTKYESVILRADQTRLAVEISSTKTLWHGSPALLVYMRDISEKKTWENHLKKERDSIKQYLDIVDVIIVALNPDQEVTLINRKGREILGYTETEILGKNWFINFLPQGEYGYTVNMYRKFLAGELEPFYHNEYRIITKKGEERIIAWRNVALHDEMGRITGVLSSGEDLTNKLAMEVKLRASERRLNTIINSNADGIIVTSEKGMVLFANPAAELLMGKKTDELIGNSFGFRIEAGKASEIEIIHKNGEQSVAAEMTVVDIEWGGKAAFLVKLRNITDQKKSQDKILRLGQFQQSVIDNANVWLYVLDKNSNIVSWNNAAEKISGYTEAEVAGNNLIWQWLYPDAEYREKIISRIKSTLKNNIAIEDFETTIVTKTGVQKSILWYFRNMQDHSGISMGAMALGRDITTQKTTEERLQASFIKLRSALEGAIKAVIMSLETRDPYTSGHQKRVAEIAKTIALEMELPTDTVEAIYIAGSMHDIGKISVPVEILSKPGKLTEPEFAIIKEHSRIGYDILKPIAFPWPVAEIVYQHHEFCNGKGYPLGLTGEQIRIEAKILAVADIIEAISSDRPYRPAIGINEAISEIAKQRGLCFDAQVVDAALKLFYEKKYSFGLAKKD